MTAELVPAPVTWSGGAAPTASRHDAVDRLPGTADVDPFQRLAAAFVSATPGIRRPHFH